MQIIALLLAVAIAGEPVKTERWHANNLAAKYQAEVEVVLHDGTRVDLLNPKLAIEVDWAPKWPEAVGQAVHYGLLTDRKPGVILLLKNPDTEWQHLVRAARVCGHLNIAIFVERVDE